MIAVRATGTVFVSGLSRRGCRGSDFARLPLFLLDRNFQTVCARPAWRTGVVASCRSDLGFGLVPRLPGMYSAVY